MIELLLFIGILLGIHGGTFVGILLMAKGIIG